MKRCLFSSFLLLFVLGCDRVDVSTLVTGPALENPNASVFTVELNGNYFSVVSDNSPQPAVAEAAALMWEGGKLTESLDETTELSLGPLDTTFELQSLQIAPRSGHLSISAVYVSPRLLTTARIDSGANTTICDVEVDYKERTLEFDLETIVTDGVPTWSTTLTTSFSASEPITVAQIGDCTYPLEEIDWLAIGSRIDAILAGESGDTFVPALRTAVLHELNLPGAGLLLTAVGKGFYQPVDGQVSLRVTDSPPWSGSGFELDEDNGLSLAMDSELEFVESSCVEGVPLEPVDVEPLAMLDDEGLSPGGSAFEIRTALSLSYLDSLLVALLQSGHGCADLRFDRELPALLSVFPELANSVRLDFGDGGRVRIQPLGNLTARPVSGNRVMWTGDLRFDLYGETDATQLLLARVDATISAEVGLETDDEGVLTMRPLNVRATPLESSLELLEQTDVGLGPRVIASRLLSILLTDVIAIPLPRPFGYRLEIVDIAEASNGWLFYLRLRS